VNILKCALFLQSLSLGMNLRRGAPLLAAIDPFAHLTGSDPRRGQVRHSMQAASPQTGGTRARIDIFVFGRPGVCRSRDPGPRGRCGAGPGRSVHARAHAAPPHTECPRLHPHPRRARLPRRHAGASLGVEQSLCGSRGGCRLGSRMGVFVAARCLGRAAGSCTDVRAVPSPRRRPGRG
jgi:hypothetical protein